MKHLLKLTVLFLCIPFYAQAQLILSEVSPTNAYQLADEDGNYPDWIEIFNPGPTDLNLLGLSLSDNKNPKWTFPEHNLAAN